MRKSRGGQSAMASQAGAVACQPIADRPRLKNAVYNRTYSLALTVVTS